MASKSVADALLAAVRRVIFRYVWRPRESLLVGAYCWRRGTRQLFRRLALHGLSGIEVVCSRSTGDWYAHLNPANLRRRAVGAVDIAARSLILGLHQGHALVSIHERNFDNIANIGERSIGKDSDVAEINDPMAIEKSEANRAPGVDRNGEKCGSLFEFKLERNVATADFEWRAAALSCLGAASTTLWLYGRLLARRPERRLLSAIMARLPRLG